MTTLNPPALIPAVQPEASTRRLPFGLSQAAWIRIALSLIILLALLLRAWNLQAVADGNTYYTAAVKAMLQSPSNFFFAAAEPGGSVTVDKPPLGLWIQTLFAAVFGVSGVVVTLPQVLAGVLAVPVLFGLVRRYFGAGAGLLAALALAVTPIAVAVDRSNNLDTLLILFLLLAAWAYVRAAAAITERASWLWLLAGAVLVGLAFNIKMLQAFLSLPAFYLLVLVSRQGRWWKRVLQLALSTLVLLAVSLSWAVAVDLTPPENRPYIGSSTTNRVFELIIGYNGLERLLGVGSVTGSSPLGGARQGDGAGAILPIGGSDVNSTTNAAATDAGATDAADVANTPANGMTMMMDAGQPGVFRLLSSPLDRELGWTIPFGLLSAVGVLLVIGRRRSIAHDGLILFGGWFAAGAAFFSAASFSHAYYLATIAAPLAGLVGAGGWALWQIASRRPRVAAVALVLAGGGTLLYQAVILSRYNTSPVLAVIAGAILLAGAGMIVVGNGRVIARRLLAWRSAGVAAGLVALLLVPGYWSAATALDPAPSQVLTSSYSGGIAPTNVFAPGSNLDGNVPGGNLPPGMGSGGDIVNTETGESLLAYLLANTEAPNYLVAVASSMEGANLVLETGRGVLYLGGFSGGDQVLTLEQFQALIREGQLRYVYDSFGGLSIRQPQIGTWVEAECTLVEGFTAEQGDMAAMFGQMMGQMPGGGQGGNAGGQTQLPFPPQGGQQDGQIQLPPGMAAPNGNAGNGQGMISLGMALGGGGLYDCAGAAG